MSERTYSVPAIHCAHCVAALTRELEQVARVEAVDVDLDRKLVVVRGVDLQEAELLAAIDEAGYDAERVESR